MSVSKCPRCEQTVYPVEGLKCLDKIWHKGCFKCHECNMTLSLKNYKGFEKRPYCSAHCPQAKATTVADTPEQRRLAENTRLQSQARYHEDFEKSKGKGFTTIADDPETIRIKNTSKIISNVAYHGEIERKKTMEESRAKQEEQVDIAVSNSRANAVNLQKNHNHLPSHEDKTSRTSNQHQKQSIGPNKLAANQKQINQNNNDNINHQLHSGNTKHASPIKHSHQVQQASKYQKEASNNHQVQVAQQLNQAMPKTNSNNVNNNNNNSTKNNNLEQSILKGSNNHPPNMNNQSHHQLQLQYQQQQAIARQQQQRQLDEVAAIKQMQMLSLHSQQQNQQMIQQQMMNSRIKHQQIPNQQMNQQSIPINYHSIGHLSPGQPMPPQAMQVMPNHMIPIGPNGRLPMNAIQVGHHMPHQLNMPLVYHNQMGQLQQGPTGLIGQQHQQRQSPQEPFFVSVAPNMIPSGQQLHHLNQIRAGHLPQFVPYNLAQQQQSMSKRVFRAMFDYAAQDVDEVSFVEGDLLIDCHSIDTGWMQGTVQRTGQTGMLPANYVKQLKLKV